MIKELSIMLLLLASFSMTVTGQAETEMPDIRDFTSFQLPEGWQGVDTARLDAFLRQRPNTTVPALGVRRDVPGFFCMLFQENAEVIPSISLTMHDVEGLSFSSEGEEYVRDNLERIYTRETDAPFRAFEIEQTEVNGYRAYRVVGVYIWRTNNIKIDQYLIPGSGRLYVVTYTNLERSFGQFSQDYQQFLDSLEIAAVPLYLGWLSTLGDSLLVILVVGLLLFGIYYLYTIRPGGGSPFRMFKTPGDKESPGRNPFVKK